MGKNFSAVLFPCGRVDVRNTNTNYTYVCAVKNPDDFYARFETDVIESRKALEGTTAEALVEDYTAKAKARDERRDALHATLPPAPEYKDFPRAGIVSIGNGLVSVPDGGGGYSKIKISADDNGYGLVDYAKYHEVQGAWWAARKALEEADATYQALTSAASIAYDRMCTAKALAFREKTVARARSVSGHWEAVSWHTRRELAAKATNGRANCKVFPVTAEGTTKKQAIAAALAKAKPASSAT